MTTDHRPPTCHYDRGLRQRVTRNHRDDCPHELGTGDCPATGNGCAPCTAPHCLTCGRNHATNDNPDTCPTCIATIRTDLTDLQTAYTALAIEALDAGHNGHLAAAAPIPGGTAQVLIGPTVRLDLLRTSRHWRDDHPVSTRTGKPVDPLPPLAILAQWEDIYRTWLNHPTHHRASLAGAISYLTDQLPYLANHATTPGAPDWLAFTNQIRSLRAQLERVLHDEREPELGVECFECGDRLVRRFRPAQPCRHATPARDELRFWGALGYPEALTAADLRAARRPCGRCDQGGLDDPRAGLSWECPGCRKEYTPGEYATAVRRDLLEGGPDRDGWTHISMAAEAATLMTQHPFSPQRIRQWVERGKIDARTSDTGITLVLWSDVRDQVEAAVERHERVLAERRREAEQEQLLRAAVEAGEDPAVAGERLGVHPARVEKFVARWAAEERQAARFGSEPATS